MLQNLLVDRIDYFPAAGPQQSSDLGADTQEVQITFTVDGLPVPQTIRLETRRNSNGEWKIFRRIAEDLTISDALLSN